MEEVKTTKSNKRLIEEIAKALDIKDAKCVGETDDTLTFAGEDPMSGATLKVVISNIIIKRFAPVEISVCDASEEAKSVKTEVELSSYTSGGTSSTLAGALKAVFGYDDDEIEKITEHLEEEEEDDDEEDYDDEDEDYDDDEEEEG